MSNNNMDNGPSRRKRSLLAKGVVALVAAGAITGLGATAAMAAEPASSQEQFSEIIKPLDSINIPNLVCSSGYLEDVDYSPGRVVPRGVQVLEPGGIGVTITKAKYGSAVNDEYWPLIGIDTVNGPASATNWDPFTAKELTVKLHCTNDLSKAAKKTIIPGFPTP